MKYLLFSLLGLILTYIAAVWIHTTNRVMHMLGMFQW